MIATVNLKWIVDKDDTKNTMLKYKDRSNPEDEDASASEEWCPAA
jgi:hypothetical protein